MRREESGHDRARLQARDDAGIRRLDREQDVRLGDHRVRGIGEGDVLVGGVREPCGGAGPALDEDPGALGGQAGGDFGDDGDAILAPQGFP